jgi:nitrate reductase NapD
MSILGVIVRSHPDAVSALDQRLRSLPGVEVADPAGAPDGRLVIVIEDSAGSTAAATMGAIALWPEVLNTSLVYEYSGPDSPPPDGVEGFIDWRRNLAPDVPLEPTT